MRNFELEILAFLHGSRIKSTCLMISREKCGKWLKFSRVLNNIRSRVQCCTRCIAKNSLKYAVIVSLVLLSLLSLTAAANNTTSENFSILSRRNVPCSAPRGEKGNDKYSNYANNKTLSTKLQLVKLFHIFMRK